MFLKDKHRISLPLCLGLCIMCLRLHAESRVDDSGRLERIQVGEGWIHLKSDVKIPTKGWDKQFVLSAANPQVTEAFGQRTWKALLGKEAGMAFEVEQTVQVFRNKVSFDLQVTALNDDDEIEGAIFELELPTNEFAGGIYAAGTELGDLPLTLPDPYHICGADTDTLAFADASHKAKVKVELNRLSPIHIQDSRKWGQSAFTVFIYIHPGNLKNGRTARLHVDLTGDGKLEDKHANLNLDASKELYRIAGLGGTYCFNIHTPVTRYTLDHLNVAFSRTEMSLKLWCPPVADTTAKTDWAQFVARDKPETKLRYEFELMRELSQKKIPYVISIWDLPEWMYVQPITEYGNHILPDKYVSMIESIGSYLFYAREMYHAEPDYFSFNEPDGGVKVAFTPEEHARLIKIAGAHFACFNLKTRMLLGDVTNPRGTVSYVQAAADDQEAMQYVGALSVHSWGGATPEQYGAWSDLARKLNLPLIVAEAGPDADWKKKPWLQPDALANEMTHYQELFLYARPQAVMYWEFSDDYSLLTSDSANPPKLGLTERFCLQQHWCNLIPAGSMALHTSSDNKHVLFTAFVHRQDGHIDYTLHIANPEWSRQVTLEGIPASLSQLNAVRTSKGEFFKTLDPVSIADGKVILNLPAQSLTTLTTLSTQEK